MLTGRLAVGGARDRCQRAQQLRGWKAANPGQSGSGLSAADIRDGRWRSDLHRRAWLGRGAGDLGLILRLASLFGELGLRILRDKFAFIRGLRLRRFGRGIGGRIELGQLVVAFAGARCGRRSFRRLGLACLRFDGNHLRRRALRRLDRFWLVRAGDQVGDGRVAGACLQAEQQSGME